MTHTFAFIGEQMCQWQNWHKKDRSRKLSRSFGKLGTIEIGKVGKIGALLMGCDAIDLYVATPPP